MKTELEFLTVHDCRVSLTANTAVVPGVLLEEVEPDFLPVACARASYGNQNKTGRDPSADIKLMQSLAKNKHTGPYVSGRGAHLCSPGVAPSPHPELQ